MPSAAELTGMGLHNLGQERSLLLNEIVANDYAHINDEYTPWHSHKNDLLDDEALILSVTVGALGVFCFVSRHGAESAKKWNFKNVTKRKVYYKEQCVRGCGALWRGELMILCGTFREHMAHKSLPIFRPLG